MEKRRFGLDDKSTRCDQKQTNPQESRLLAIQRCNKCLVHACQCRDTNCRLPRCRKMKSVVQHAKSCKQKLTCPVSKCPVLFCRSIKNKIKPGQRLQHGKGFNATVQNRWMSGGVLQTRSGNSNSSSQPSPGAQPHSSSHPPQPGIGMKLTTGPPVGALQAVQVQAAAARQTAAHMVAASVNYGNGQQSSDECIICYEKPVDCALYRCGHTCMCYNCAFKLWKSNSSSHCPICRSSIQDVLKIYK